MQLRQMLGYRAERTVCELLDIREPELHKARVHAHHCRDRRISECAAVDQANRSQARTVRHHSKSEFVVFNGRFIPRGHCMKPGAAIQKRRDVLFVHMFSPFSDLQPPHATARAAKELGARQGQPYHVSEAKVRHELFTHRIEDAREARPSRLRHLGRGARADGAGLQMARRADGEAQTNWRPDDADVFARSQKAWLGFGPVDDYPSDIGTAILYGETQLSVFKLADGQLFVTQNMCPHKQAFVLSQGLVGDADGLAKVACPLHKKTFGLADGAELGGGDLKLVTFDARVGASGDLEIHLPPREEVDAVLATPKLKVTCDKAPKQAPAFAR
mmetsp:Transcript_12733/g.41758  ORF Transcript_12733/g.41758 Transcript_12733/m.41758 type:complete len:331 (-) Transcript_12733:162-1154(-)